MQSQSSLVAMLATTAIVLISAGFILVYSGVMRSPLDLLKDQDNAELLPSSSASTADLADETNTPSAEPQLQTHGDIQYIITSPAPNEIMTSPYTIEGEISGSWYFEGQFLLELWTSDGVLLAQGIATAQEAWMTEDLVPFTSTLTYTLSESAEGTLILNKDNPSGLPENDDQITISVTVGDSTSEM